MFPVGLRWIRAYAIAASVIGVLFLTIGMLSIWAVYSETSGTTRLQATVTAVQPPVNSTDSVHLAVKTTDGRVYRVATSSEDTSDFSSSERTAILVKKGQEPVQDAGSGRYTGSLVLVVGGLVPLSVGIALWRTRGRLARAPRKGAVSTPLT